MAVSLIKGHPPRYIGLSTDDKPVIESEALLEAEFIETDTKLTYVYTGDTWIEKTATYVPTKNYVWDTSSLAWVALNQPDPVAVYKISDLDTTAGNQFFGYVNKDGGWYIMNLTDTTARYIKGDSGYLAAWVGKGDLEYDYFHNIF